MFDWMLITRGRVGINRAARGLVDRRAAYGHGRLPRDWNTGWHRLFRDIAWRR